MYQITGKTVVIACEVLRAQIESLGATPFSYIYLEQDYHVIVWCCSGLGRAGRVLYGIYFWGSCGPNKSLGQHNWLLKTMLNET